MATATLTSPTKRELRKHLNAFQKGRTSKIQVERDLFGSDASRGKRITRLWRDRLGVETTSGR